MDMEKKSIIYQKLSPRVGTAIYVWIRTVMKLIHGMI